MSQAEVPTHHRSSLLRVDTALEHKHAKLTALAVALLFFLLLEGLLPAFKQNLTWMSATLSGLGILLSMLAMATIGGSNSKGRAWAWLALCLYTGAHIALAESLDSQSWRLIVAPLVTLNLIVYAPGRGTAWLSGSALLGALLIVDATYLSGQLAKPELLLGIGLTIPAGLLLKHLRRDQQHAIEKLTRNLLLQSSKDEVTGLANRGRLITQGEQEISRSRRHNRPLSVVLLKLDNLAEIEEQNGRQYSTQLLQSIAAELGRNIRDIDVAGRLSSNIFMLLLPETPLEGSKQVVNRLGSTLSTLQAEDEELPFLFQLAQGELLSADEDVEDFINRINQQLGPSPSMAHRGLEAVPAHDTSTSTSWLDPAFDRQDLLKVQGQRLERLKAPLRLFIIATVALYWIVVGLGPLQNDLFSTFSTLGLLALALSLGARTWTGRPQITFVSMALAVNLSIWLLLSAFGVPSYYWALYVLIGLHVAAYLAPGPSAITAYILLSVAMTSALPLETPGVLSHLTPMLETWGMAFVSVVALGHLSQNQAAEVCRLQLALKTVNTTDALTEVFNRVYVLELLAEELNRSRRYGQPVSLLIMRVTGFSGLVNKHGKGISDELLRRVAKMMGQTLRRTDLLGRLREEDFIVVLPETANEGAIRAAERLRSRLSRARVRISGLQMPVSANTGIATFVSGDDIPKMLQRAEDQLRASKNGPHGERRYDSRTSKPVANEGGANSPRKAAP